MLVLSWSLQGFLCAVLLIVGSAKIFLPEWRLLYRMPVYTNIPLLLVRLLGFLELLAAIGILLPELINIAPTLTIITSVIVAAMMLGAVIVHIIRGEYKQVVLPSLLFLAALAVAMIRLGFSS